MKTKMTKLDFHRFQVRHFSEQSPCYCKTGQRQRADLSVFGRTKFITRRNISVWTLIHCMSQPNCGFRRVRQLGLWSLHLYRHTILPAPVAAGVVHDLHRSQGTPAYSSQRSHVGRERSILFHSNKIFHRHTLLAPGGMLRFIIPPPECAVAHEGGGIRYKPATSLVRVI